VVQSQGIDHIIEIIQWKVGNFEREKRTRFRYNITADQRLLFGPALNPLLSKNKNGRHASSLFAVFCCHLLAAYRFYRRRRSITR